MNKFTSGMQIKPCNQSGFFAVSEPFYKSLQLLTAHSHTFFHTTYKRPQIQAQTIQVDFAAQYFVSKLAGSFLSLRSRLQLSQHFDEKSFNNVGHSSDIL